VTETGIQSASISLAAVRVRGVSLHWHEAVAIVQGVIEELSSEGSDELQPFVTECPLTLEHIEISSSGAVLLIPGGPLAENFLDKLLKLLGTLLEPTAAPPELRAIADRGRYAAPADLSRALLFFERPNRSAIIAAVANRALEAEAASAAEVELHRLQEKARHSGDVPAKSTSTGTKEKRHATASRKAIPKRWLMIAGASAFVLLLVGGLSMLAGQTHRLRGAVPRIGAVSWKSVTAWAGSTVSAVSGRARALVAAEPARPAAVAATNAEKGEDRPRGDTRTPGVTPAKNRPTRFVGLPEPDRIVASVVTKEPNETAITQSRDDSVLASSPSHIRVDDTLVVETSHKEPAVTAIYSNEDADVIPPIMVRPQLPREQKRPVEAGTLEIVVSETGDVDQVRLISPFNRYHDRMLVAAAKAWRFHVATRDGQPVKYRLRVQIAP